MRLLNSVLYYLVTTFHCVLLSIFLNLNDEVRDCQYCSVILNLYIFISLASRVNSVFRSKLFSLSPFPFPFMRLSGAWWENLAFYLQHLQHIMAYCSDFCDIFFLLLTAPSEVMAFKMSRLL